MESGRASGQERARQSVRESVRGASGRRSRCSGVRRTQQGGVRGRWASQCSQCNNRSRSTDRQTDRQTDRHTHVHTRAHTHPCTYLSLSPSLYTTCCIISNYQRTHLQHREDIREGVSAIGRPCCAQRERGLEGTRACMHVGKERVSSLIKLCPLFTQMERERGHLSRLTDTASVCRSTGVQGGLPKDRIRWQSVSVMAVGRPP